MNPNPNYFKPPIPRTEKGFTILESIIVMLTIIMMVWVIIPGWRMRDDPEAGERSKLDLRERKADLPAELPPSLSEREEQEPPVEIAPLIELDPAAPSPPDPSAVPDAPTVPDAPIGFPDISPPEPPDTTIPAETVPGTLIPATPAIEVPDVPPPVLEVPPTDVIDGP